MMKKVSVIVPAYNAHGTLARCLGSLVNQTLEDIEIIAINDASADDTLEIMNRCQQQYPDKVVIIDGKVNRGPGGARNQGIDVAQGEYIGFADADDYVASNMYELLYKEACEKSADIVECGFFVEATNAASITVTDDCTGILDREKRNKLILKGGYLWTKIIRRSLLNDPPVRMRENVRCLEDNDYIKYLILKANSIWNVKEVLYNYSNTPDSAVKTDDFDQYCQIMISVISGIHDLCSSLPRYGECKEMLEYTMINWYSCGVIKCLYDQIARYGASDSMIDKYFAGAGEKEKEYLKRLAAVRRRVAPMGYRDNPEVVKRISELDIKIMEKCDELFA